MVPLPGNQMSSIEAIEALLEILDSVKEDVVVLAQMLGYKQTKGKTWDTNEEEGSQMTEEHPLNEAVDDMEEHSGEHITGEKEETEIKGTEALTLCTSTKNNEHTSDQKGGGSFDVIVDVRPTYASPPENLNLHKKARRSEAVDLSDENRMKRHEVNRCSGSRCRKKVGLMGSAGEGDRTTVRGKGGRQAWRVREGGRQAWRLREGGRQTWRRSSNCRSGHSATAHSGMNCCSFSPHRAWAPGCSLAAQLLLGSLLVPHGHGPPHRVKRGAGFRENSTHVNRLYPNFQQVQSWFMDWEYAPPLVFGIMPLALHLGLPLFLGHLNLLAVGPLFEHLFEQQSDGFILRPGQLIPWTGRPAEVYFPGPAHIRLEDKSFVRAGSIDTCLKPGRWAET